MGQNTLLSQGLLSQHLTGEILYQDLRKLVQLFEGLESEKSQIEFPPTTKKLFEAGYLFAGICLPAEEKGLVRPDREVCLFWMENVGGARAIVTVDFGSLSGPPIMVPHGVIVVTDSYIYFHADRFHSAEGLFSLPENVSDEINRFLGKAYSRITFWQQLSEKNRFYSKMASFLVLGEENSVGKLITW